MANIKKTQQWAQARVLIAPLGTAVPKDLTTAWNTAWKTVGLLDGEAGLTHTRSKDSSENFAWGGVLYRRTISKQRRQLKFSALEDNATVFGLVNPGSVREVSAEVQTSYIKAEIAGSRFMIGYELKDPAYGKTKRAFATMAEVSEVGDIKEAESATTIYEITVDLVVDPATGVALTVLETDTGT